jgi:hypothetical protein
MAAYTHNTGSTIAFESLTGGSAVAAVDTHVISNSTTLLIRTDTYACTNHSTAVGSLDTVSFSGTGGVVRIDPTYVKYIAYTAGSGNSPAFGTTITSTGGATGVFLGAWTNWQSEPIVPAAAIGATGFIKIGNVVGDFAAGALTGITATCSGIQKQAWIEVRGADVSTITVPRIGKFETVESYFELGTTTGVRNQVIPCPTTGNIAGIFPGVWIETTAGSGIYERFASAGSIVALAAIPTDERGKIIWQTTAGIRIGFDGTNNVGYLPPVGCKVRIPAAILTNCTRTAGGSGIRVLPNATIATRQEFVTTSAGDISINGAVVQWYCNFVQPYRAVVKNSFISDSLIIQESASALNVDNITVSPTQAQLQVALNCVSNFAGGSIQNSLFTRFSLATSGAYINTVNYNKNVTFTNVKTQTLLNRGNATTGTWTCTQNINCTWTDCLDIGARSLHASDQYTTYIGHNYLDNFSGTTSTANPHYSLEFAAGCTNPLVNGLSFAGLVNQHPYNGIASFTASYNIRLRNIGTAISPLSLGSANQTGVIVNFGGNCDNATVQRCYTSTTRTGTHTSTNTDNNIVFESVVGDYADTSVITSLNTIMKGCKLLGATTGQTAVYGSHWKDSFTSATVGKIEILCNEPTTASASQCLIASGTPQFNSVGQLAMTVLGQQVQWEMPYFAKGHTALANLAITLTGTNTANLSYEFQYDKGVGYNGVWLVLNAANLTAVGAIVPATGIRLKIRATCTIANAGNLLTNIAIPTVTTSTDQNQVYVLDPITFTVAAQVSLIGAEIRVYDLDNLPTGSLGTELGGTESSVSETLSIQTEASNSVWVQIMQTGYAEFGQQILLGSTSSTFTALLVADNNT